MPITTTTLPSFPIALSAPFAGQGEWTFRFYGGPLDGAISPQELTVVLRRLDLTKWWINRTLTRLYFVHAIDRDNHFLHVAHTVNPWMGG